MIDIYSMMAAVRASKRVSIAWREQDAYEDTDTLVLTIHDFSLDLRVFNSGPQKGQMDWSTVAKVSELEGSTKDNLILKWDHIIDSRPPTGVDDQGSFETLDNGDVTETGRMFNPNTGNIECYVETWRRCPSEPGAPYCLLELISEEDVGYLGRVGDHVLGCGKRSSGEYIAWRDTDGSRGYEFGTTAVLPPLPKELPEGWREGGTCRLGNRTFVIKALGVCA